MNETDELIIETKEQIEILKEKIADKQIILQDLMSELAQRNSYNEEN